MKRHCQLWALPVLGGFILSGVHAEVPDTQPAGTVASMQSLIQDDVRYGELPGTNTVFKPAKYSSLDEWKQRRAWLREQVRYAAGLIPELPRTPLNAKIFDRIERDGYSVEKVYFESMPGFYVTGNLYRPTDAKGKLPAVATPHGHWPGGRLNHEERGSVPVRCIMLAKLGAVVFSYDMVGYNDSKRQIDHREEVVNSPAASLWGISSLGLHTWNSIRVLDFLQSLPDVDPERIGVTGASGGGTQTFILCAVDDRVKVAAPVNMISSTMQGGCICENAPCLRIDTNNMEIGALFAPRPMLLVSATGDWTKLTPEVEYPMIRGVYKLYGAADKVHNVHVDAEHNYNRASREAMYRFFAKHLLDHPDPDSITEPEGLTPEKDEDLLVFTDDSLPENMLEPEELVKQIKEAYGTRVRELEPDSMERVAGLTALVQTGIRHAVGSAWPDLAAVHSRWLHSGSGATHYERLGRRAKVVYWGRGHSTRVLMPLTMVLHPEGAQAAHRWIISDAPAIIDRGDRHAHAYIEPFGCSQPPAGSDAEAPRDSSGFFSTFNRTDSAEAVFDLLTVFRAELHGGYPAPACLIGVERTGLLVLPARAMVPGEVVASTRLHTVVDMNQFDPTSDEAYLKELYLPGVRRVGGLEAVAAVAANGPLWLHNVHARFDLSWVEAAAEVNGVELRITREKATPETIAEWLEQKRP